LTANLVNVLMGGMFHAAVLFLSRGIAGRLRVQKIFNLACAPSMRWGRIPRVAVRTSRARRAAGALHLPLALGGLAVGLIGVVVERGLLRFVYDAMRHSSSC